MPIPKKRTRRVVLRSTERPKPAPREKLIPVIIEVAADGFLTVFGPRHIRPIIFNRLVAVQPEEADLVDEFHELELPRPYRELYSLRHILKTHNIAHRTVDGETQRRERLAMLRGFQSMGADAKKGSKRK